MGFQGDLDSFGLANVFQNLTANQQTGTLHVFDRESHKYLVFSKGSIHSVSTGKRSNISLTEILVARGKLDEATLADIPIDIQRDYEKLSEVLLDAQICTPEDIETAMRFQMEEEIYDLFIWKNAKFTFEESSKDTSTIIRPTRVSSVKINTSSVLLEAMRRIDEWERLQKQIPDMQMVPIIPDERQIGMFGPELTEQDKYILAYIDGVNDVETVVRKSCLGRYTVVELLGRLLEANEIREANQTELADAADEMMKKQYYAPAARLFRRLVQMDRKNMAPRRKLARALEELQRYEEAADQYNRLAERLCEQGETDDAIKAAKHAVEILPDDPGTLERLANLYTLAERMKDSLATWLKLLHALERRGDIKKALAKLDQALADHEDETDLMQFQARLLLSAGSVADALRLYERLGHLLQQKGNIPASISAYRTILRHKPERADLQQKIRYLQEKSSLSRRLHLKKFAGALIGLAFLLGFGLLALREFSIRSGVKETVKKSMELTGDLDGSGDATDGIARIQQALALLEENKPGMNLSGATAKWEHERQRLEGLAKRIRQAMTDRETQQQEALARWSKAGSDEVLKAEAMIQKAIALAPKSATADQLREILTTREKQKQELRGKLDSLLSAIADRTAAVEPRYAAYRTLIRDYPASFYREQLKTLSLPVDLLTRSEQEQPLAATVAIGKKSLPEPAPLRVEMPCDPDVPLTVSRTGFALTEASAKRLAKRPVNLLELDPQSHTPLRFALTLTRKPTWGHAVTGVTQNFHPDVLLLGKTLYCSTLDGALHAVDATSGISSWKSEPIAPKPGRRIFLREARNNLYLLTDTGYLSALDLKTKKPLWPNARILTLLQRRECTGISLGSLTLVHGPDETDPLDLLIGSSSPSPLFVVDTRTGSPHWSTTKETQDILHTAIGRPAGAPFHHGSQILVVSRDGTLHVVFDNGAVSASLPLDLGAPVVGDPLFLAHGRNDVLLFVTARNLGLYAFRIDLEHEPRIGKHWPRPVTREKAAPVSLVHDKTHLYASYESGRVMRMVIASGVSSHSRDVVKLPGPACGPIALTADSVVVPFSTIDNGQAGLAYVRRAPSRMGPLWSVYETNTRTTSAGAVVGPKEKNGAQPVFFLVGNALYRFDDEVSQ